MMGAHKSRCAARVLALAVVAWSAAAPAQDFPTRPIRLVVGFAAGGTTDFMARLLADKLREPLGQPVVVENRTGQAGNIGAEFVYGAEPDGYTLLASQPAPLTVNVLLYKKLNFDPTRFEPVAILSSIPNTLTVRPDFPAKNMQEFLAYARAHPGTLNYASQGIGTTSHLTAELFSSRTGIKMVHVPYRGTAPAINDLIASQVDLMFSELASAIRLHQAGRARILAVSTRQRNALLPDIPTLIESGVPDFESDTWNAISAPPKTPPAIVAKLNAAIVEVLKMPEVREKLQKLTMTPEGMTPAQAAAFIKADTERWAGVIKAANIQPLE
jgi:tripartite-type tricarboxylate transporter receptor subunit TctC